MVTQKLISSFIGSVLCAIVLCSPHFAHAQTSFPMIISTYPTGVERGKTTDVVVTAGVMNGGGGANLYGAYKAAFEGDGIKAEIVPPPKGWPAKDPKKPGTVPDAPTVTMRVT